MQAKVKNGVIVEYEGRTIRKVYARLTLQSGVLCTRECRKGSKEYKEALRIYCGTNGKG